VDEANLYCIKNVNIGFYNCGVKVDSYGRQIAL